MSNESSNEGKYMMNIGETFTTNLHVYIDQKIRIMHFRLRLKLAVVASRANMHCVLKFRQNYLK